MGEIELVQSDSISNRETRPAIVDGFQGSNPRVAREAENYFAALIAAQRFF